jgi:hypothetical protein
MRNSELLPVWIWLMLICALFACFIQMVLAMPAG